MKSWSLLLLVAFTSSAFARLGETLQQCEQRYGKPAQSDATSLTFQKSGFFLIVYFFEGKCDKITYRKVEQNALGKGVEISDNELSQLMQLNAGGRQWKKINLISMDKVWQTEDGEIFAKYETIGGFLVIAIKDNINRANAAQKSKEDGALKGF